MIQLADCLKRKGKKIPQKHQNVPQSIGKNKKGKIIQLTSKVKVSWECYTMWKKITHLDLKFTKEICMYFVVSNTNVLNIRVLRNQKPN